MEKIIEPLSCCPSYLDAYVCTHEAHGKVNGGEGEREVEGVHLEPITRQDEACDNND